MAEGRNALVPAQRVVAAVPDFSWGWAAVAGGYWKVAANANNKQIFDEARASGREAADRAVAIDSRNSEALYIKAVLLDESDWLGREDLFKRAVAARRLDCGCEHHQYGSLLLAVGRTAEALEQLHQANNMLALYLPTPMTLAEALVVAGKPDEAKRYFDAATDLAPGPNTARRIVMRKAALIGDINLLLDPTLPFSAERRPALLQGYRAVASRDSATRAQAVQTLLALPEDKQDNVVTRLLADLGANHEAFQIATRLVKATLDPSMFWDQKMRATLADPGFPEVVTELGLLEYWKTTGTRPDVCGEKSPPLFCGMI